MKDRSGIVIPRLPPGRRGTSQLKSVLPKNLYAVTGWLGSGSRHRARWFAWSHWRV